MYTFTTILLAALAVQTLCSPLSASMPNAQPAANALAEWYKEMQEASAKYNADTQKAWADALNPEENDLLKAAQNSWNDYWDPKKNKLAIATTEYWNNAGEANKKLWSQASSALPTMPAPGQLPSLPSLSQLPSLPAGNPAAQFPALPSGGAASQLPAVQWPTLPAQQ